LERAEAALTCRQGDFAEDPSEEGKRTESVRGKLTNGGGHSRDAYKKPSGLEAGGSRRFSRGLGVADTREHNPAAPFNGDEQIFDRLA
jgi:hypothetical protein